MAGEILHDIDGFAWRNLADDSAAACCRARLVWRTAIVSGREQGFWSLNSLAVQPCYALCREGLRHLLEHSDPRADAEGRARLRAASAAGAGMILCAIAVAIVMLCWPASRWIGEFSYLMSPQRLIIPTLANAAVISGAYFALAALTWGIADASMDQPRDLARFDARPRAGPNVARCASVGSAYRRRALRFSHRERTSGAARQRKACAHPGAARSKIHAKQPLDLILITGDITDAGRSAEWAEFLNALAGYPKLAKRMLLMPGNHDVNVVDRANPAMLELPASPGRGCARCAHCRPLPRYRETRFASSIRRLASLARASISHSHGTSRTSHLREFRRGMAFGPAVAGLGRGLSDGAAARHRRRPWCHRAQLHDANTFFVHQCARSHVGGAGAGHACSRRAISARALDRGPASSPGGISQACHIFFGADRDGADQRHLVRASAAAAERPDCRDARTPPHRLDRALR